MTTKPAAQEPEVGKVFGFTGPHRRAFVRTYVLSKTTFFWRDVIPPGSAYSSMRSSTPCAARWADGRWPCVGYASTG